MKTSSLLLLASCGWLLLGGVCLGHPIPDIPIRSFFEADGSVRLEVELDVRCFAEDPENEPYLWHAVLREMAPQKKERLIEKAQDYIEAAVKFVLEPEGGIQPEFQWTFTTHRGEKLEGKEDPVMLTGKWTRKPDRMPTGYQIEALSEGELSVLFLNHVDDVAVERFQVLFPGEKSYLLDPSKAPGKP